MEQILIANLSLLAKCLSNTTTVLLLLVEKSIFSTLEMESVDSKVTEIERHWALLKCLMKKSNDNLSVFLHILCDTGNESLAEKIEETTQRKGFSHLLSMRPHSSGNTLIRTWWPERKQQTKIFCERKVDGELIIEKLHAMLQENENRTTVITQDALVVSGLGGIGKTSIAKSFAHAYEDDYDHILWIDCGEKSLAKSFKLLANALNIDNRNVLSLKKLARECFAKLEGRKCLVIYDNAECYIGNEGIRDVLPKFGGNNIHSIITSRNQNWGTSLPGERISTFLLNVFNEDESLRFMERALKKSSEINISDFKKLADLLGHLPLALQIAVATLNTNEMTITDYMTLVANDINQIIINEVKLDDYELTIKKTMKISLDQIRKDENGENAYSMLMNFGYISPDAVNVNFLIQNEKLSIFEIVRGIDLLQKYSLVTIVGNDVSIHRLLQQVIRFHADVHEKQILKKILLCDGDLRFKLIPCSYIKKYKDLSQEFSHVRAQLIEEVQLIELFAEKSYSEAVKLSLMIHQAIAESPPSEEQNHQFLISLYNHAVCMQRNGQFDQMVSTMEVLSQKLISMPSQSESKWWTIQGDDIDFLLMDLSENPRIRISSTFSFI